MTEQFTLKEFLQKEEFKSNEFKDDIPIFHGLLHYEFVDYYLKNSKRLVPNPNACKWFNEKLLYLYLGKSEYWPKESQKDVIDLESPVSIGYNLSNITNTIKRCFPFDSGAYKDGRFKKFTRQEDRCYEFEINPQILYVNKFIDLFYQNLQNYLNCKLSLKFNNESYPHYLCIKEILRIHEAAKQLSVDYGEQAFTVEFQFESDFTVEPCVLILPSNDYQDPEAQKEIQDRMPESEILYYRCHSLMPTTAKYVNMRNKVLEYTTKKALKG